MFIKTYDKNKNPLILRLDKIEKIEYESQIMSVVRYALETFTVMEDVDTLYSKIQEALNGRV